MSENSLQVSKKVSINELRKQVETLEVQRSELIEKLKRRSKKRRGYRAERDRLNGDSASCFAKVNEIKKKRDATNQGIHDLKLIRAAVLNELKALIEMAKELSRSIPSANNLGKAKRNSEFLQRSIRNLDWQIQTTPKLTGDEEKALIDQIDEFQSQLDQAKLSENQYQQMRELNKEINSIKHYLDDSWRTFNQLVGASQNRHQRLVELYNTGKEAKQEADHNHELFVQKGEDIKSVREEIKQVTDELRQRRPILREHQLERRRKIRKEFSQQKAKYEAKSVKDIREKLSVSGREKFSLEEMKILVERKLIPLKAEKETDNKTRSP